MKQSGVYKPGSGEVSLIQDLLRKRKAQKEQDVKGMSKVVVNPCTGCPLRATCPDVDTVTQCSMGRLQPRRERPRPQPNIRVYTLEHLCRFCDVSDVCSMANDSRTQCVLFRQKMDW